MAKKETTSEKKIHRVMHEFKEGDLKIGRSNKKVTSREQAIAIGLSQTKKQAVGVNQKIKKNNTKVSS
jgi:hypothetical protein